MIQEDLIDKVLKNALDKIDELHKQQFTKYELKLISSGLTRYFNDFSDKRAEQIKNNSEIVISKQHIEDIGSLMNKVNSKINNGEFKL